MIGDAEFGISDVAEVGIMNSELSKLTIKKDVQKNVSVSFDNCIESNRGCLWGNQMSPVTQKQRINISNIKNLKNQRKIYCKQA